ncbi:MAG: PIN domain-containing protein [Pirellulales bacterium]
MIILDTNVVSELMRPKPNPYVEKWLAAQVGGAMFFTAMSEAELRHGVAILAAGRRRNRLVAAIDEMLARDFRDRILPFDRESASA